MGEERVIDIGIEKKSLSAAESIGRVADGVGFGVVVVGRTDGVGEDR